MLTLNINVKLKFLVFCNFSYSNVRVRIFHLQSFYSKFKPIIIQQTMLFMNDYYSAEIDYNYNYL